MKQYCQETHEYAGSRNTSIPYTYYNIMLSRDIFTLFCYNTKILLHVHVLCLYTYIYTQNVIRYIRYNALLLM